MATWEVGITDRRVYHVRVEADSYTAAMTAAMAVYRDGKLPPPAKDGTHVSTNPRRQIGEPWVYGGWYDLHGPGDVIVFERAFGNRFTAEDVAGLGKRLTAEGLTVRDSWNGAGATSVSFRCDGRPNGKDDFTPEQTARLCAPRDWPVTEES